MKESTSETGSCRRVRGGGLWAAILLLLILTSWAAVSTGEDQADLVLDLMPDYLPYTPSHWGDSIIPSPMAFTEYTQIPLPDSLFGDATSYFSYCYANSGEIRGTGAFFNDFSIDDTLIRRNFYIPFAYHNVYWINEDQYVSGGRHTLWQTNDPENNVAEHNENNNSYARQWIWEPQSLALDTQQLRTQPPERLTGTEFLPAGVPVLQNMDGMNLAGTLNYFWRGVAISNPDFNSDYDLFLYSPSTGIGNGFDNNYLTSSTIGGPNTDAIIINLNYASSLEYDVGILNWNDSESDYRLRYQDNSSILYHGHSISGTIATNQVLKLIELNLWTPPSGVVTLDLQCDTNQEVRLVVFNHDFTVGSIYDATHTGLVQPDGRMLIELNSPEQGHYGIAIFRNAFEGTDAFNYTLKAWSPTPDLAMVTLPGSYAPLIPRNNINIYPGNPVPAPAILDGDMINTVFYWHMANLGSAGTPLFNNAVNLDGVSLIDSEWPYGSLPADSTLIYTGFTQPVNIPGGRHTTGMMLDSQNSISEIYENNNHFAEQWVWNPFQLEPETSITRVNPPAPYGGWDQVANGMILYNNVDGLRTQTFENGPGARDGYWGAVALLPHTDADLDLHLHSPTTGPDNGFEISLVPSGSAGSSSEFILIDFDGPQAWGQSWDAGALRYLGDSDYTLQSTRSQFINHDGLELPSAFGSYEISPDQVISLTEFSTENYSGEVSFVLDILHQGGDANFGVKVFARNAETGFYSKAHYFAVNETGGPGADKTLELTLPGGSFFGLVVYKLDHNDFDKNLQFDVRFRSTALSSTPEEQDLPSVSKIEGIYPNPFNPQTTIRLAMKQSGSASVKVYDVQGRLVRTLVEGELSAGRHDLSWTGVDNAGRSVPSGVYFVRAVHPDGVDQQRMSLVK